MGIPRPAGRLQALLISFLGLEVQSNPGPGDTPTRLWVAKGGAYTEWPCGGLRRPPWPLSRRNRPQASGDGSGVSAQRGTL